MKSSAAATRSRRSRPAGLLAAVLLVAAGLAPAAGAQWAAAPGDTVRNAFGPEKNQSAPACRGACGLDCPSSCDEDVEFECAAGDRLLRVRTLSCGTHQACRDHDDCLDRCSIEHGESYDCAAECHADVMSLWPPEQAISWAAGGGPFDTEPIWFEYTKDRPGDPEAFYRCPEGAERQCIAGLGLCQAQGHSLEPVFAGFDDPGATLRIANFRSGSVCLEGGEPSAVCRGAVDITVRGEALCTQAGGARQCTWYGFQFDYENAMPGESLYCQSSGVKDDFMGGIVTTALKSANTDQDKEFGSLLSGLQRELNSGKSLDQVFAGITITTEDGQTLGGQQPEPEFASPGVPNEVELPGSSGHLLVPIFELKGAGPPGSMVEHQVRCSHQGRPVIETTFRLHFTRG